MPRALGCRASCRLFAIPPCDLAKLYPRLGDYREVARRLDPQGKFRNEFVRRYVFAAPLGVREDSDEGGVVDAVYLD